MTNVYKAVAYALKTGALVRQPCEVCGSPPGIRRRKDWTGQHWIERQNIHAHHDDYSKPLDVRWLCVEHHEELHRRNTTVEDLMGEKASA